MCGCRLLPTEPPSAFPTSSSFPRASADFLENKLLYFPPHRVRVTRGNWLYLNQRVLMSPAQHSVGTGKQNLGWKRLIEQQNESRETHSRRTRPLGFCVEKCL